MTQNGAGARPEGLETVNGGILNNGLHVFLALSTQGNTEEIARIIRYEDGDVEMLWEKKRLTVSKISVIA